MKRFFITIDSHPSADRFHDRSHPGGTKVNSDTNDITIDVTLLFLTSQMMSRITSIKGGCIPNFVRYNSNVDEITSFGLVLVALPQVRSNK